MFTRRPWQSPMRMGLLIVSLSVFLAPAAQADLFVASTSLGTVLQYDESTGAFISDFATGQTPEPRMVLVGPDGNFYAISNGNKAVVQFDSTGNVLNKAFAQVPAGGLNGPRGMIFDQASNLYVSCKNANKVEQYDP